VTHPEPPDTDPLEAPHRPNAAKVVAVAVGLVIAVGVFLVIGHGPSDAQTLAVASPLPDPVSAPRTVAPDLDGRPVRLVEVAAGSVSLLAFGYTRCPGSCAKGLDEIAQALGRLTAAQRQRIRLVFVTVDPARDGPSQLQSWLRKADPSFVGVVPTAAELSSVVKAMGLPQPTRASVPGGYTVAHSGSVDAFTSDGLAHATFGQGSPASIAADLRLLLAGWKDSDAPQ
jgi:protein SCO1/2